MSRELETIAQEVMSTELITIQEGATVEAALKALINNRVTGLPVVDSSQKMIGVVSEYDILRQIANHPTKKLEVFQQPIEYSKDVFSVNTKTPLSELVSHFLDAKYRRVPVVDPQGKLVGIITRRDLMRVFYYRATLT